MDNSNIGNKNFCNCRRRNKPLVMQRMSTRVLLASRCVIFNDMSFERKTVRTNSMPFIITLKEIQHTSYIMLKWLSSLVLVKDN